jgi:hypothetical protein
MKRRSTVLLAIGLALIGAFSAYLLMQPSARGQEKETLFEVTNRKLAAHGMATLASEVELTWVPATEEPFSPTPASSSTPAVPECAQGTIHGAAAIVAQYGGGTPCRSAGRFLYFAISGYYDTPLMNNQGGIAVYACADADPCLRDRPLAAPGAWTFYPFPEEGRFKVGGFVPPNMLILGGGSGCFMLDTGEWPGRPCPMPTSPPGTPSPPE